MAEEYVPDEGTRYNPKRTTKWRGDWWSTLERFQNNDRKDDPRTREKNGCTEWEVTKSFNKALENIKNNQTELKNSVTEMKNTLEWINSRISEEKERISELKDRVVEITAVEQNKEERKKRNEDSLRDLWENIKCTNIHIIGVPERDKRPEKILEGITAENFPIMRKETVIQVQGPLKSPIQD